MKLCDCCLLIICASRTHSDSDRDKMDFLLVQFFSHCAPSRLEDRRR